MVSAIVPPAAEAPRTGRARRITASVWAFCLLLVVGIWWFVIGQVRFEHGQAVDDAIRQNANRTIAFEQYVRRTLEAADLVTRYVGGRFARGNVGPEFVGRYPHQIINIHHSFLPAFIGSQPYRQAFERGVKIIGATAHFVTESLDEGPIIAQSVIPVDHTYTPATMARAGRDVEKLVLAKALRLVFEERVFLVGNRTIVFD